MKYMTGSAATRGSSGRWLTVVGIWAIFYILLCLLTSLAGCARSTPQPQPRQTIPESLLTPLPVPLLELPVTVEDLLLHVSELEGLVDIANARFDEIRILQGKGLPQ